MISAWMGLLTIRTTLFPVSAINMSPHASKATLPIGALSVACVARQPSPAQVMHTGGAAESQTAGTPPATMLMTALVSLCKCEQCKPG